MWINSMTLQFFFKNIKGRTGQYRLKTLAPGLQETVEPALHLYYLFGILELYSLNEVSSLALCLLISHLIFYKCS